MKVHKLTEGQALKRIAADMRSRLEMMEWLAFGCVPPPELIHREQKRIMRLRMARHPSPAEQCLAKRKKGKQK